jgi:hypothetical protein
MTAPSTRTEVPDFFDTMTTMVEDRGSVGDEGGGGGEGRRRRSGYCAYQGGRICRVDQNYSYESKSLIQSYSYTFF